MASTQSTGKRLAWRDVLGARAHAAGQAIVSPVWHFRAALAVGVLLLIWALAHAAVPYLLKWQIEKAGSEKLGRMVTVRAVEFKPWSLELMLYDLAIAQSEAPGKAGGANAASGAGNTPQLQIRRIHLNAQLQSLVRLAPVVEALEIDQPVLSVVHLGQGRYDFDDVLARLQSAAPKQAAGEAPKFALYNLVLSGGRVNFNDQPVGKNHELKDLKLMVPFLSNLKSKVEIKTSPRLAFTLNGSSFDTSAEGTPFAQTRKTDAHVKLSGFDLSPYLAYFPASLPFRVQRGLVNLDAQVAFEQTPDTVIKISGSVSAENILLRDASESKTGGGHDLLAFDQLRIDLQDVRPLERVAKISAIELTAPVLSLVRDRAGRLTLIPKDVGDATKTVASGARESGATGTKDTESGPWKVGVSHVAVRAGRVNWLDESLQPPAQVRLAGLTLDASAIALPFAPDAPLQFKGSLGLQEGPLLIEASVSGGAAKTSLPDPALLTFSGTATDQAAQVSTTVAAWPLQMAAKYVGQFLLPALNGRLDAQMGVSWQAASGGKAQALRVNAPQIALHDVQLAQGKVSLVSVKQVDLAGVDVDIPGQTFKVGKLQLIQPRALVERGSDQRWMYEGWMAGNSPADGAAKALSSPVSTTPSPPPTSPATRANAPTWAVAINEIMMDGGAVSFSDKASGKPVNFEINAAKAQLSGLELGERRLPSSTKAAAAKPMPLSASMHLSAGRFEAGKIDFKGSLGLTPLQVQGQLQLDRLPVQAFEPYFADTVNIDLLRADASFKGRVAYSQTPAGPAAQIAGDVALEEFKANTLAPSEELLAWKALNLRGLSFSLQPAKATQIDVKDTVLTDFFARVIVTPQGRINLQDLLKPPAKLAAPTSLVATKTIAITAHNTGATAINDLKNVVPAAVSADQAGQLPSGPPPIINFGPMRLVNGTVLFSDRFVKPNYSADLSELNGKLSAFSSVVTGNSPSMADLELRGRAEGTASLEILGKLNPLVKPLALDISGKVRDLELPPLSPYSVKYSGYGISRGKLSVDVNYLVLPSGQLTAKNKVILNQLNFGDKVEGSNASLPVKLAVALLADRNGVIDIDLPISGSLNDPQFSLGPVIAKVILNVIVKAITAPFSLLANAFGGGDELSTVGFTAGSARLEPEARAGLDKVAKALADRPSLRLTVVGTSSLEAERDGFRRERLDELVRAEKRRSTVKEGGTTSAVLSISPAEYPALLKEVYKRADITKPRNVIGLAKDIPTGEMEKLLLADIKVNEEAMQGLAVQRGVAVKDYLVSRNLPLERLFLGASKTVVPEAKWTPRAELNLALP
jgi:hypothetical protein